VRLSIKKSDTGKKKKIAVHSVHDAWLEALRDDNSSIKAEPSERTSLLEGLKAWMRPLSPVMDTPYRLALRLEEPEDDGEKWVLRFLLQGCREESLIIEVKSLWDAGGTAARQLSAEGFNYHDYLLSAFGDVARISKSLERSIQGKKPGATMLTTEDAYSFLINEAPQLSGRGFALFLPSWWSGKGTGLSLSAKARTKASKWKSASSLSMDELVEFQWEAALGGIPVDREELERLAALKVPLVRVRGQWMSLNAEELQQALSLLKKKAAVSVRDTLRLALAGTTEQDGLTVKKIEVSGWLEELLGKLQHDDTPVLLEEPEGFTGTLRPYQKKGLSWLSFLRTWGMGACLADDMGLGKTVQALALIQHERLRGETRPVLLVCPTSVSTNWQKEAERFTPGLRVMIHHGAGRAKGDSLARDASAHDLVISTYALLHRDREHLGTVPWAGVVLDEAQNIKNAGTLQARAARSLRADYRIALTGTPVENSLGDLWSLMEFLNPGYLGKEAEFRRDFFIPIQVLHNTDARERLRLITAPLILRRMKTDRTIINDLPDKIEMKEFCTLTKEQATLYSAALKDIDSDIEEAEGIERRGKILGLISRLKQICNHPAQFLKDNSSLNNRSGKLSRLADMVEEILSTGDRALIFTQFAEMGELLKRYLEECFGQETLFLHGGVPKQKRDVMVDRFQQEDQGPSLFILSLKAGGTGLNLTRASHVFHFDRWWNPAVESQATDRAYRIGQSRNVQVHTFITSGTLEERIDEMIEQKKELAGNIIGAGEGWLTELSTKELRTVLALRKGAVTAG
jgi:SNF2 family DNA or RNA helicase